MIPHIFLLIIAIIALAVVCCTISTLAYKNGRQKELIKQQKAEIEELKDRLRGMRNE